MSLARCIPIVPAIAKDPTFNFVNENIVYACGVAGTIVKTSHSPGWNTEIKEIAKQNFIYPNPAKSLLTLRSTNEILCISFLSIDGKLVYKIKNPNEIIDISFLKTGTYFIRLESNSTIQTERLVKH